MHPLLACQAPWCVSAEAADALVRVRRMCALHGPESERVRMVAYGYAHRGGRRSHALSRNAMNLDLEGPDDTAAPPPSVLETVGPVTIDGVQMIRVWGVLAAQDEDVTDSVGAPFGASYAALHAALNAADARPEPIMLLFDTPGGVDLGAALVHEQIASMAARRSVAGYVELGCHSMGLILASQVTRGLLWAAADASVGSIGAMRVLVEESQALQERGLRVEAVTSHPNKDTGADYRPVNDADRAFIQQQVNESAQRFRDALIRGRGVSAQTVATWEARMLMRGAEAAANGLIDAVVPTPRAAAEALKQIDRRTGLARRSGDAARPGVALTRSPAMPTPIATPSKPSTPAAPGPAALAAAAGAATAVNAAPSKPAAPVCAAVTMDELEKMEGGPELIAQIKQMGADEAAAGQEEDQPPAAEPPPHEPAASTPRAQAAPAAAPATVGDIKALCADSDFIVACLEGGLNMDQVRTALITRQQKTIDNLQRQLGLSASANQAPHPRRSAPAGPAPVTPSANSLAQPVGREQHAAPPARSIGPLDTLSFDELSEYVTGCMNTGAKKPTLGEAVMKARRAFGPCAQDQITAMLPRLYAQHRGAGNP